MKWLHNQGCPWNEAVTHEAMEWHRLLALRWLIENGCPYDPGVREYTLMNGIDCLGDRAS